MPWNLETFSVIKGHFKWKYCQGSTYSISPSFVFEDFIQLETGEDIVFLFTNEAHLLKNEYIIDQFTKNVKLCLLKPIEFETKIFLFKIDCSL